jgi:hypothetical protein
MTPAESSAAWIADVMLRSGGWLAVLDFECAFDESGTHEGSPIVCVAGYIMEKSQARELDREWNEVLNWADLEHPLEHFHMADCAPDPGNGVFAGISKSHRKQIVSRMIGIIKRRTIQGLAATISVSDFNEHVAGHPFYPDPYVVVSHMILSGVSRWIEAQNVEVSRVAYFFETGHKSRSDAEALMSMMFRNPIFGADYHHAGHAFIPKNGNPIVQAADLLAWQWLKDRKNAAEGRPRRKDLESLLGHPHQTAHIDADRLHAIAATREPLIQRMTEIMARAVETSREQPS